MVEKVVGCCSWFVKFCGLRIELNWWAYVVTWCLKLKQYAHMHACTQMNVVHSCFVLWDQVSCSFPKLQSVLSSKFWRFHNWKLQWYSRRFHGFHSRPQKPRQRRKTTHLQAVNLSDFLWLFYFDSLKNTGNGQNLTWHFCFGWDKNTTRWAPTSCKWIYNPL